MTTLSSTERGEHTPGIVERLRVGAASIEIDLHDEPHGPADMRMARDLREAADLISELVGALDEARDCIACDNGLNAADGREPGSWTHCDAKKLCAEIDAVVTKAHGGAE